ncbi:unnamed protein product [Lymnaea stagnalis]|uniref:H15 domain-containing protein n=1 Tax=Lymnaea stagnalis TaxID=6523 RepID=A0AAV2IJ56_LYMST
MSEVCSSSIRPKYREMIAAAIKVYKKRTGSSRQEILKYITSYYNLGENHTAVNHQLKLALKACVHDGNLIQTKGSGANGSFRLVKTSKQINKAKIVQATKPTGAKKSPVMSQTLSVPQNMLPQQIAPVALYVVKSQNIISKAADFKCVNLQNNAPPHAPIQRVHFPDNSAVHNVSSEHFYSPKSLTLQDTLQNIKPPINGNAAVSKKKFHLWTKDLSDENEKLKLLKMRILKNFKENPIPVITCTHPIVPELTSLYRNCKLCYIRGMQKKSMVKCYVCNTFLCLNGNRNCLLEFHKRDDDDGGGSDGDDDGDDDGGGGDGGDGDEH